MQENEFEKSIREKMEVLKIVPTDEVWRKVSEKIKEDKKRRRVLFFLLPFTVLVGLTGFYLFIKSTTPTSTIVHQNNIATTRETIRTDKAITTIPPTNSGISKTSDQQKNNKAAKKQNVAKISEKVVTDEYEEQPEKEFKKEDKLAKNGLSKLAEKDEKEAKKRRIDNIVKVDRGEQSNTSIPLEDSKNTSANEIKIQGDLFNEKTNNLSDTIKFIHPENKKLEATKDSIKPLLAETKAILKPKVLTKKLHLGFTAFSGISNNKTGLSFSDNSGASYANSTPAPSNVGQAGFSASKLTYSPGFSYGAGIYLERSFSKRIDFSAGINYHFLSATSPVGARVSSNQSIYDASLQSNSVVNQVYGFGQISNYRNKYKTLELPLNILFQLNKNQNRKLSFIAGITPAFLVAATALYASNSQNFYYETSEQFKKLIWSLETGIQLSILSTRRFDLIAGPEVQYGINNMAKTATGTNQHLTSASLKINIISK